MSNRNSTLSQFQDLVSAINTKLNDVHQQFPVTTDANSQSCGSTQKNSKKSKKKKKKKKAKHHKHDCNELTSTANHDDATIQTECQTLTNNDTTTKLIAKDFSATKNSLKTFTNNAEKRRWYYETFQTYYQQLPSHLRVKYDVPMLTSENHSHQHTQVTQHNPDDYAETLNQISQKRKLCKPPFKSSCSASTFYVHNKISPPRTTTEPAAKKRKLHPQLQPDFENSAAAPVNDDDDDGSCNNNNMSAQQVLQNDRKRDLVWKYYDECASYYYTRYLHYSSLQIQEHWSYVRNEYTPLKKIYMAEYADPEALARHLAIKSPDAQIPDKYWYQRYRFFRRYDEGIAMDIESWYSATPELIAANIARKCKCNIIIDAMCGSGGNAIAFAKECDFVIAIDIDANKLKMAKHNATIYGVAHKIQFMVGDFFELAARFAQCNIGAMIDCVFLSPPWGGTFYLQKQFDIRYLCDDGSMNGVELFEAAKQITPNIAYYLPKNTDYRQLRSLCTDKGQKCQITKNALYNKVKAITAYYGSLCEPQHRDVKAKKWTKKQPRRRGGSSGAKNKNDSESQHQRSST